MSDDVKTDLVIEDVHHDSDTGHITVYVFLRSTRGSSTWTGPTKGYGVDDTAFHQRFNGSEEDLLKWVAAEHLQYRGRNPELTERLAQLKGRVLPCPIPPTTGTGTEPTDSK